MLLTQINLSVEIYNQGQLTVKFRYFINVSGQDVVMFHWHNGHMYAGHCSNLTCP